MNAPKTGILASMVALARIPESQIPRTAHRMARLSLFDWMVVGWAGRNEPLGHIIRDYVRNEGGHETASLIGGGKVPVRGAALANGTVSHALDYDDTHFAHMGHPSVAILPAALSAAEEVDAPSKAVVDAFLLGAEASVRIGMVLGRDHYLKGFHQTATSGAFGATIAAGRIYGLDEGRMRHAPGLCATKASGLKSQFGTMGKPLNAGLAAANGVECAGLAARGFISCDDGIEGPQGFLDTHSVSADREAFRNDSRPGTFLFGNVSHKFHACCHGAHAMIEALLSLRTRETIGPGDVARVALRVNPRWLGVCDIKSPRTGLEVKFSYAWLAGMVFAEHDTAASVSYSNTLCTDPDLMEFAKKVVVEADASIADSATSGTIRTTDGRLLAFGHDLAAPLVSEVIEQRLRHKARALAGLDKAEKFRDAAALSEHTDARALGALLRE